MRRTGSIKSNHISPRNQLYTHFRGLDPKWCPGWNPRRVGNHNNCESVPIKPSTNTYTSNIYSSRSHYHHHNHSQIWTRIGHSWLFKFPLQVWKLFGSVSSCLMLCYQVSSCILSVSFVYSKQNLKVEFCLQIEIVFSMSK